MTQHSIGLLLDLINPHPCGTVVWGIMVIAASSGESCAPVASSGELRGVGVFGGKLLGVKKIQGRRVGIV